MRELSEKQRLAVAHPRSLVTSRHQAIVWRSQILRAIREFFYERDFLEIEASLLVTGPGSELHIDPIAVPSERFLITSPEFQMKRLLVGGLPRIFSLGKCFRQNEEGPHHNPEFTMLEWYRSGAELSRIMRDTEDLCRHVATACTLATSFPMLPSKSTVVFDLAGAWPEYTVRDLFAQQVTPLDLSDSAETFRQKLLAVGIAVDSAIRWDDLFFCAFLQSIEPWIARQTTPIWVTDWPAQLGALARRSPRDSQVVERAEVYFGAMELANGFGELTDPTEQAARFAQDLHARKEIGKICPPVDQAFLNALREGMPASAGIALGVDRLVMLALGLGEIQDALAFSYREV